MNVFWSSLSGRLLFLTVAFVMLSEVLVFVPSAAQFRLKFLEERIEKGRIAALAATEARDSMLSPELQAEILQSAGLYSVVLTRDGRRQPMLMKKAPDKVAETFDLREAGVFTLISDAMIALSRTEPRMIRVIDAPAGGGGDVVEIVLPERDLYKAMTAYSWRIFRLSLLISVITAGLVFLSVNHFLLRPIKRVTSGIMRFREDPEDASRVLRPSGASGEIGDAERELARTQADVVSALKQKSRLAALGEAVAKINHDLRNMLATSQLLADRLESSRDPMVRKIGPKLLASLDRAVRLCQQTLAFGKAEEPPPRHQETRLSALVEDVRVALGLGAADFSSDLAPNGAASVTFDNRVSPDLVLSVDPDQVFRALHNLARNAHQALEARATGGLIAIDASVSGSGVSIDVADDGPGLPQAALDNLFKAFKGSQRPGGSGLGLAIASELIRAHGGALSLAENGPDGVRFRIILPLERLLGPRAGQAQDAPAHAPFGSRL